MDEDAIDKSPDINEIEKSDVPTVIKQISEIQVPSHIIENIDVKSIGQRFSDLFEELDRVQEDVKELDNAGIIKKFLWAVSGKTTEVMLDAQQIQAELAKLQSMLILLNTMFAKELNRQQTLISKQQKIIEEQNEEIKNHQKELEKQNEKLLETQEVILKLVNFTNEQEEVLRNLFSKADYIRDVEKKFNHDIGNIRNSMQEVKADNERGIKGFTEYIENVIGELSSTKESLEQFGNSYTEDKKEIQDSINSIGEEGLKKHADIHNRISAMEEGFNHKIKGLFSKGLIILGVNFCIIIGIIILLIFGK